MRIQFFPVVLLLCFGSLCAQTFTDASHLLDTQVSNTGWGASAVDFNNDGYTDIYTPGSLYLNVPGSGFRNILFSTGIIEGDQVFGAAFGDYDNDAYPDILFEDLRSPSRLYRNERNLAFTQTDAADVKTLAQGAGWADFNLDGLLDLFVNNDDGESQLFKNLGNGEFEDISLSAGVQEEGNSYGMAWGDYDSEAFSASWGDLDNDGDLDLIVARAGETADRLFINDGLGGFTSITQGPLVEALRISVSTSMADVDNDGDLDIMIGTSGSTYLYMNNGDATFQEITSDITVHEGAYATAWADVDRDGDQDVIQIATERRPLVYTNMGSTNHWLNVRCVGTTSNRSAIGARVRVKATINGQPTWQMREISAQTGYISQNSLNAAFGLRDADVVDSLQIEWPSGTVDVVTNLAADQFLTATEGAEVTDIEQAPEIMPEQFALQQNYPNPFNPETKIRYFLPEAAEVRVTIFNTLGQRIRILVDARQDVGTYDVTWDGRDDVGAQQPSGVYYYRIRADDFVRSRAMLLLK